MRKIPGLNAVLRKIKILWLDLVCPVHLIYLKVNQSNRYQIHETDMAIIKGSTIMFEEKRVPCKQVLSLENHVLLDFMLLRMRREDRLSDNSSSCLYSYNRKLSCTLVLA